MLVLASLVLVLAAGRLAAGAHSHHGPTTTPAPDAVRLEKLEKVTEQLARQLMLQQLYVEERARSDGGSGLKQLRMRRDGLKSYHVDSFSGHSVAAIHDHSNLARTIGMGEMVAVLNGLEFRTRHNDYKLRMPGRNKTYNLMEDIPFPPVPRSVLNKHTVEEQSQELREYFKAWRDLNATHRDYKPYFKPVLCYLEGAWTLDKTFSEPFASDRHAIEANSWFDLQEKIRFTSMTGDRLNTQNYAYLPTTIYNITDGVPSFAQWNYRILCHPLKAEVNVSELQPMEDLAHRMGNRYHFDDRYFASRVPRYSFPKPSGSRSSYYQWNMLDDWMGEIPGKDNYGVHITDDAFGLPKLRLDKEVPINVGNYHRRWKVGAHDAMGDTVGHRGFADRTLFVAENTQPRIAPVRLNVCTRDSGHKVCQDLVKRVTYAIPLELVYMTPLQSWNPYNIEYRGKINTAEAEAVTADHRNGGKDAATAYNGTHSKAYYLTPIEFFSGAEVSQDPADTTKAATGVLDRQGKVRLLKSSGIRINLPNIPGVGSLRTRFPIMPVFAEGAPVWKEMEAMRDMLMDMDKNKEYMQVEPEGLKTFNAMPSHHGR